MINGSLVTQGADLIFAIRNDSVPGVDWVTSEAPTITRIYFDSNGLLGSPEIVSTTGSVVMSRSDSMNLPGGNSIGFATDYGYDATVIPEPATLSLVALSGLALFRRRRS